MKRNKAVIILLALFAAIPCYANLLPTNEVLKSYIGNGAEIEARLDADLTGNGVPDTAFIGRADGRILMVLAGVRDGARIHYQTFGETGLPDNALVPAKLSLQRHVLIIKDITGGDTATAATYRYRYDSTAKRLQLIGLDAERYSRTAAHEPLKLSWNLLTGEHLVYYAQPRKNNAAYRYTAPDRTVRKTAGPVWIENTPPPAELVAAEIIPEGEDRD